MSENIDKPFFRKIDWASFWTATLVSFVVYFLTLGPSVGLEDSGELAVAGDHLGVPHPPGYPIWSMISYVFARVFSFVTFRGQPNPAWAIALGSAVFGALAAGCTAMLITRSAADMLAGAGAERRDRPAIADDVLCWVGGVAGSLVFAFSPVMWSQSTIVEVYSLGAFFLMLVMLLTYRWMRRPSDKLLWVTAFVFGLGLTNYQVLLLAALPLVVIIFLRDIALFRDFLLVVIPFGLAAVILKLGSLTVLPGLPKLLYLDLEVNQIAGGQGRVLLRNGARQIPVEQICNPLVVAAVVVFCLALAALLLAPALRRLAARRGAANPSAALFQGAAVAFGLSIALMLAATLFTRTAPLANPANHVFLSPTSYAVVGAALLAAVALSALAAVSGGGRAGSLRWMLLLGAFVVFVAAIVYVQAVVPTAPTAFQSPDPGSAPFDTRPYTAGFALGTLLMLGLALTTPSGICFALPVAIVETVAYVMVLKGAALGLTHPSTWWFCAPAAFNFVILALATLALPNGRPVAATLLMGELGVSFYAYMPIVSDLRNPPMNWGYPRTWEGFKHAITRGQYEAIKPTNIFAPRFLHQVGDYFIDLRRQFTLLLAPFGFLPFAAWRLRGGRAGGSDGGANGEDGARARDMRLVIAAACLALVAVVLWGVDSFVPEEAISDGAAGVLRLLSALLMAAAVAAAILGGVPPLRLATGLIGVTVFFVVLGNIPAIERSFDASRIDKLAFGGLLLIGAAGGLWMVYSQVEGAVLRAIGGKGAGNGKAEGASEQEAGVAKGAADDGAKPVVGGSESVVVGLVVAALALAAVGFLYKVFQAVAIYRLGSPLVEAKRILDAAGRPVADIVAGWSDVFPVVMRGRLATCVVLPGLAALLVVAAAVFALRWISRRRAMSSSLDDVSQQWNIGILCNFLLMSVALIMLANPRGDLQDTFIQKVKFISSHGLFALWIGYGLVFAVVALDGILAALVRGRAGGAAFRRACVVAAVAVVFLSPAIPVEQNYCNDRLVFELSGAEQNGHDYGWQFGNYQLRGADAITEELEDDEEPLPNPLYPPEMGQGAVFYGGTDPGRFVPTYMIYSADVRPDVFLITQNALADNTFMSVTRDLYGDQIWIPTPKESESAFGQFVEEVQSGKRPANSSIVIENGRVQVVGALGVMEINGILCKMIFDHNKPWHKFYVEESYVIPWMYPYLTPHGLIMHINPERTQLGRENVEDDMDFWDWYVRRLTRDGRYRRDIVAQKSFSKLRSAIAGLYFNRGRTQEAERAYNDARVLYPVSPEATFRYVQDILIQQRRYDEALEVVDFFCSKDPNNDRGPYVRDFVGNMEADERELSALLARVPPSGKPALADALRIAKLYGRLGAPGAPRSLLAGYVDEPGLNVGDCFDLALALEELGDAAGAARAMSRVWQSGYVMKNPERLWRAIRVFEAQYDSQKLAVLIPAYIEQKPVDWQGWVSRAILMCVTGRDVDAWSSLMKAYSFGGQKVLNAVENNPVLRSLYDRIAADSDGALPGVPAGAGLAPAYPGTAPAQGPAGRR